MNSSDPYAPPKADSPHPIERQLFPELTTKELKKLRDNSHTIRTLGIVAVIAVIMLGIICLFLIETITSALALSLFVSIPLAIMMCYCSIKRPNWGPIPLAIGCIIFLLGFPLGTLIGLLGLFAVFGGLELFGPGRPEHRELEREWRHRKENGVS